MKKKSKSYREDDCQGLLPFYSGLGIVLVIAIDMIAVALGLMVGARPGPMQLVFSFAFGTFFCCRLLQSKNFDSSTSRKALLVSLCGLTVFAVYSISIIISSRIVDLSWDGNTYHKAAVAALRDGWNPNTSSVEEWSVFRKLFGEDTRMMIWIDHYAQGLWFVQSSIYATTGLIEASKATTICMMVALTLMLYGYLVKKGIRRTLSMGVALTAAINPITAVQLNTFYCDGFLMICFFSLVLSLVLLVDKNRPFGTETALTTWVSSFVLCAGTKFTGLAYASIVTIFFSVVLLYRHFKGDSGYSELFLKRTALTFIATVVIVLTTVGWTSYCSNLITEGNPLYPLAGDHKEDIVSYNQPASFASKSTIDKLLVSTFGECSNAPSVDGKRIDPVLKIPGTANVKELESLRAPDLRISGFGVFNSCIVLIGVPLLLILCVWARSNSRTLFYTTAAYTLFSVLMLLTISESWWARYSFHYYGIVLIAFFFAGLLLSGDVDAVERKRVFATRVAGTVFSLVVGVNMLFCLEFGFLPSMRASLSAQKKLESISAVYLDTNAKEILLSCDERSGLSFNLNDLGVTCRIVIDESMDDADGTIGWTKYKYIR